VTVHEWNEDDLPGVSEARELFVPKASGRDAPAKVDAAGRRLLPVAEIAEILADGDATDYGQLEPVPSGFYEDAENGRALRQAA
jgi:hypothetical protein